MFEEYSTRYFTEEEIFNNKFPLSIVATLAVVQMLTTFVIFALEVGHNILHIKLANLFVGFWIMVPFTVLWISMFAVVCCCRRRSCATHALIQNIISLIFSGVLIGINSFFIQQPNKCFFNEGFCRTLSWTSYISEPLECFVDGRSSGCGHTRVALIVGQLASAALMIITCLIYIIVYSVIYMRASKASRCQEKTTSDTVTLSAYPPTPIPVTISHHQQPCTLPSHPYYGTTPLLMTVYSPLTSSLPIEGNCYNRVSSNQLSISYPARIIERF